MYVVVVITVIIIVVILYPHIVKKSLKTCIKPLTLHRGIPRLIFRTHKTLTVSENMHFYCHQKWLDLNPNHSVIWSTGEECEEFVRRFDPRIHSAYTRVRPGAYKADIWRACVLYVYGGVYTDSYTEPYQSLAMILHGCLNPDSPHQFISILDKYWVHNGFIVCTPKHPFIKQYLVDMITNVENKYYGNGDLEVTGPGCLWKSINKSLGLSNRRFKAGWNKYDCLSFYLFTFCPGPSHYVYKKGNFILRKKYSLIELIIQKFFNYKTTYFSMWKNKQIYETS